MRRKEWISHGVAFQSIVTTLHTCSNCNAVCKQSAAQKSEEQCIDVWNPALGKDKKHSQRQGPQIRFKLRPSAQLWLTLGWSLHFSFWGCRIQLVEIQTAFLFVWWHQGTLSSRCLEADSWSLSRSALWMARPTQATSREVSLSFLNSWTHKARSWPWGFGALWNWMDVFVSLTLINSCLRRDEWFK